MRIRIPIIAFLFVSFFSCNKTEDPIVKDPVIEEPIAEDEKNPELTVNGFTEVIETYTDVAISIVDESTVETKVMHDGEELASSTEKQFDLSINPYVIPVGSTDFVVISKDAKGNEVTQTYSVEIKHLLMTYGYSNIEKEVGFERWLFFNDAEGKELKVIQPEVGDNKIYTDENILGAKVFFSVANYLDQFDGSFENLYLQTYQLPLGKFREGLQGTANGTTSENVVDVQLNGVFYEDGWPQYYASGPNYYVSSHTGDDTVTNLQITHDGTRPIFITPFAFARNPIFDGKKENFGYVKIDPEAGNTSIALEFESLIPAENYSKIEIPTYDTNSLSINRYGYESEQDFTDAKGHKIYDFWGSSDLVADYVDLPIISDFQIYNTSVTYSKDGTRFSSFGNEDRLILEMPNWEPVTQIDDTTINLSSSNQEVDYYILVFNKSESATDFSTRSTMSWGYNFAIDDNSLEVKLPRLSLPQEISDYLVSPFFQNTADLVWNRLTAYDYEKYDSYDQLMRWRFFGENPPTHMDNNARQITINNPNYTGKSSMSDNQWGAEAFQNYDGLDEMRQMKKQATIPNSHQNN